jgi:hypothetical protein
MFMLDQLMVLVSPNFFIIATSCDDALPIINGDYPIIEFASKI